MKCEVGMRKWELGSRKLEGWNAGRLEGQEAKEKLKVRVENIELIGIVRQKLRMEPSFFPHSTFRIPTFILFILIFAPCILLAVDTPNFESGILSASLEKDSVPVGGVVWLTLDYRLPEGGRLPEAVEVSGLDGISILRQIVEPQQVRIQLIVDRTETWQSDPIQLEYLDSNGEVQYLAAKPLSIRVVSNITEKADAAYLRPIRDIDPVKSIWQSLLMWLAVSTALVLIGAGLFWWYKKRQTPVTRAKYAEPPHMRACRELRGLEAQQYFEKGLVKQHYFIFSEILRHYLESIRHFPAAEFTTEEIARWVTAEPDRKLVPLLQQADLVKFADTVPTRDRKEADLNAALAYIRETTPQIESVQQPAHQPEGEK